MPKHLKTPDRTVRTLALALIGLGFLFTLVGCAQVYKFLGLTEKQTKEQVSKDQKTIIRTITEVRTTTADIISATVAGIGALASGLLARLLGTERKITKAMIVGIEKTPELDVKKNVRTEAISAGIEKALHKRVASLT